MPDSAEHFSCTAFSDIALLFVCGSGGGFCYTAYKIRKSGDPQSITLSSLPKLFSYRYRSPVSVFRENNSDKRTYLQRLKVIIIPAVTFTFMYFIYGVYETYFANMSEWKFIFMDILPPSLMILAILILLSCGAAYFIKGKILIL